MSVASRIAIGFSILTACVTASAQEFDGYDAMPLAQGKRVETDCSITWKNPKDGKTGCCASARNQFMFQQNTRTFVPRAKATFDNR